MKQLIRSALPFKDLRVRASTKPCRLVQYAPDLLTALIDVEVPIKVQYFLSSFKSHANGCADKMVARSEYLKKQIGIIV